MSKQRPLEGVKVIDMSTFIGAPACARFFAEFGAEVVKIEPKSGDLVRFNGVSEGRLGTPYENTTWDLENAHKLGLALDLKAPEGREILFRLLETTDIFITNWRPQAIAKLGLDYESLKDKYPKLVYASFTGYGEEGPDMNLPGYDFTAFWARSGLLGTLYQKDGEPINLIPGIGDHTTGWFMASGIMVALYITHRKPAGATRWKSTSSTPRFTFRQSPSRRPSTRISARNTPPAERSPRTRSTTSTRRRTTAGSSCPCPPFDVFYPTFMPLIGHPELVGNPRYTMKSITENKLHGRNLSPSSTRLLPRKRPTNGWKSSQGRYSALGGAGLGGSAGRQAGLGDRRV
jgi:cinnamoyl-CoA:phenyllactate CoA-transferase